MATLTLTKLWINRLDTGEAFSAQSGVGKPQLYEVEGEVRTYAGGRQRSVTAVGERADVQFLLRDISMVQRDVLRLWASVPVQVRDSRGQVWLGVFYAVPITEDRSPAYYDALLHLYIVTVDDPAAV